MKYIAVTQLPLSSKEIRVHSLKGLRRIAAILHKPVLCIHNGERIHMGLSLDGGKGLQAYYVMDSEVQYVYYKKNKANGGGQNSEH